MAEDSPNAPASIPETLASSAAAAVTAAAAVAADVVSKVTDSAAKLQLDEETGEWVSKSELKKILAKRAKKAAQTKAKEAKVAAGESKPAAAAPKQKTEDAPVEPDAMFKQGFLYEVFKNRPMKPVVTRFPPEPNGHLHIGHAKAIAINFGFARYHGGKCYLRYDDTNPAKEKEEYFASILEAVQWLGFEPAKITYTSDYFGKLFEMGEKLITLGKAYVCHCDADAIKLQRGGDKGGSPRFRCEHAERSAEENAKEFHAMRDNKYAEGEAFLRMKQDLDSGNPQMWDIGAFRIKKEPHYRTGADWVVYAGYDMSHCVVDSFEGITHSLCTTEFINNRESYEWLNKTLGIYEPQQREYGRLNMTGTVLSKRRIDKLITEGIVRGQDDPRLHTLTAIRRRGIPPGAVLDFINELGVTTAISIIDIRRFEWTIRKYLERTVPRLALVLDPVRVVIEDAEELELDVPLSPKVPEMGSHKVRFTPTVYVDSSDFRPENTDANYYRLSPGKTVGLLQVPYPIRATSFSRDPETGKVTEVRAVFDKSGQKPKTYIQWVGSVNRKVEARIYNPLFKSDKVDDATVGFLDYVNPDSEVIYPNALVEEGIDEVRRRAPWPEAASENQSGKAGPETVRFQALRVAYFAMDKDSADDQIVLNRIVSLKEDSGKS